MWAHLGEAALDLFPATVTAITRYSWPSASGAGYPCVIPRIPNTDSRKWVLEKIGTAPIARHSTDQSRLGTKSLTALLLEVGWRALIHCARVEWV